MNQEKIGAFIQEERKKQKLTQSDLAERLGISKNAVSKWERGICLMDMSLLKPLSKILKVSVNDILSGERLKEENFEKASEENIVKLTELINLKASEFGIKGMAIFAILLILISTYKNISPYPIVSLLCAYNAGTFLSRYKIRKEKIELFTGILFIIAVICNTVAFILS